MTDTPLKIVSIIPYKVLPAKLGGEKGIALFTEYLGRRIPLTAISTRNNSTSTPRSYGLLNLLSNARIRYANLFLFFTIRNILKKENATHLLIEHPYYGWLAYLLKKSFPVTWVVHSHNIEYMRSKSIGRWWWKVLEWYETWVYKKADINFFISEDDRKHATQVLRIDGNKSFEITYGVEQPGLPDDADAARREIRQLHRIAENEIILLYNGALYHHSNYDAVTVITEKINPLLLQNAFRYKIIICGKGLPTFFRELKEFENSNIIYAGFVDDINIYFKAADIFLNPILSGGGVKTKAIEAISMNCTVVSTSFAATGIHQEVCGEKLQVVPDHDWGLFAEKIINVSEKQSYTPHSFYDYYYWDSIAKKVETVLKGHHA